MAIELPISEVAKVAPLFAAVPQDQACIRGALRDRTTRLFVDDINAPSVAALRPTLGDVAYFAGAESPRVQMFADVVRLLIASFGATANSPPPRLAMPFPAWSVALAATFAHGFAPRGRRSYTLIRDTFARAQTPLPPGYELRQMDEALARDAASDADPEIVAYWPDPIALAAWGAGFCAVEASTGRVASVAWPAFHSIDLIEIGVGTAVAHRGRGLSPAVSAALIRWCLERGLDPRWSTDFDNIASRRVAAKLGFANVIEHDWPLYTPFNAGRKSIDLPEETTRDYHGRYTANGKTITIGHDGVALRFFDQLGQTLTLAAETQTRLFLREVPIQLEFTRGADGRVDGFTREQSGKQWRMERTADEL